MTDLKRKGSKSKKDIPPAVQAQLNAGLIESANLVEWLAVDQKILLHNLLVEHHKLQYLNPILTRIDHLKKQTVNTINEAIGHGIFEQIEANHDVNLFHKIAQHPSDTVRCWASYMIARNPTLSLSDMFEQIQLFAADSHFGVREIAWLAMRPQLAINLMESLAILKDWTSHQDENIRRFASEATRPRGVWCEHIKLLKAQPELGLSILEALKSDTSKYVQNSVANWLNDASKTEPKFVIELCEKWANESQTQATAYIIKKALRSIEKK
jgi:3-methyladenine DNA glycosylase AlkC